MSHSRGCGSCRCFWGLCRKGLATLFLHNRGICFQVNSKQDVTLPIQWGFQTAPPMATGQQHHQSNTEYSSKRDRELQHKARAGVHKAWGRLTKLQQT